MMGSARRMESWLSGHKLTALLLVALCALCSLAAPDLSAAQSVSAWQSPVMHCPPTQILPAVHWPSA